MRDNAGNAGGVVAIALIDLHLQGSLGVPGIDANDGQPALVKLGPKPSRCRPCLKADTSHMRRMRGDELGDRIGIGGDNGLPDNLARLIDDTHGSLLQRNVQSDIVLH